MNNHKTKQQTYKTQIFPRKHSQSILCQHRLHSSFLSFPSPRSFRFTHFFPSHMSLFPILLWPHYGFLIFTGKCGIFALLYNAHSGYGCQSYNTLTTLIPLPTPLTLANTTYPVLSTMTSVGRY